MNRPTESTPQAGPPPSSWGKRIVVIGSTGAGKTTLARELARLLGLPHVELDAFNWGPNWTQQPDDVFRQSVAEAVSHEAWVVDGNYRRARDLVWPRATAVVWLDYPFPVVLGQLLARTFRRALRRETLWHGNRESLATHLFTRDSLILWLFQSHWRHRREYGALLRGPEYAHLARVRLASPGETTRWLAGIGG